jgi:hypothetical protein
MSLEKDLQSLGNHEHFARFLKVVSELREETIEELHNASNEQIQQISGRILTYDQSTTNVRLEKPSSAFRR